MAEGFDPYYEWLGIPPKDQPPNHYRLLGIELFEPNENVIDRAADRQMGHVRTFQTGRHARESQQLLNELSRAKLCLLNREKKTEYDAALRAELGFAPLALDLPNVDEALPPAVAPVPPGPPLPPQVPIPPEPLAPARPEPARLASSLAEPGTVFDFAPKKGTSSKLAAIQRRRRKSMWPALFLMLSVTVAIVLVIVLAFLTGLW